MAYKYITENNLYNKQTYMYSEYNGICFLKEYVASRQKYLNNFKSLKECITKDNEDESELTDVMQDLLHIKNALKSDKWDKNIMDLLNAYTKTFEVRKRIYQEYDNNWKPTGIRNFEDYKIYLTFAECLLLSYQHTQRLKYFSCLLKLDDVLLSVWDKIYISLKEKLYQIIKKELVFFYQEVERSGIRLEE